jgi:hypothetical protein
MGSEHKSEKGKGKHSDEIERKERERRPDQQTDLNMPKDAGWTDGKQRYHDRGQRATR